jgi:transposase
VEEYVSESDPVRVYDAFVDSLDFDALGISVKDHRVGAPPYDPRAMLKLLVYGYSYGIRSSRKLERACYHNLSFIWIVGGLNPDHKTISEFRRNNRRGLKKVLKQCSRLCMKLGLIEGNVLFLDSSKIRANASIDKTWTPEKCEKYLKELDEKIDELLCACDKIDDLEKDCDSLVELKLKEELSSKENLREKVKAILSDLEAKGLNSLNSTDSDCVNTKGRQGSHASYTANIVTDEKNGLIVNSEVVSQSNDTNQFSSQISEAEKVTGKKSQAACSDAGYNQIDDLEKISSRGTQVVVPNKKQASKKKKSVEFDKENFNYDEERDEYICPEGNRLKFRRIVKKDNSREYRIESSRICLNCKHYGVCTKSKGGRTISRLLNEKLKDELAELYESDEGQRIYRLRKQKVELPFGFIKRNLGAGHFLLRGREGVNGEMALLSTSFNLSRMINLLGIAPLLAFFGGS